MGKKKGKRVDPDKKAALQAKKEAKADKAAQKRLQKENQTEESFDSILQQYQDEADAVVQTTITKPLDGYPPARANATLTLYEDGKRKELYLFGGEYYDGLENVVVDHLCKFDLQKQAWSKILTPVKPPARCAHSAVYYNHAIYIFGGERASLEQYYHYRDFWRFDIKSQTWREIRCKTGSMPSARSGHAAVLWKNFMIIFGGFYEAMKDTPRWYNDVYVMNLQTETWLDNPHSKLASRPEPRSACNVDVIGDDMVVHGGFSKLTKSVQGTSTISDTTVTPETKVHTDAWVLHLKPLLADRPPVWERLTSSTQRGQISTRNPNGRAGMSAVAYKNRLICFGGVVDKEQLHHKMDSIFYNDLFALDVEHRKWIPINARKITDGKRRRRKQDAVENSVKVDEVTEVDEDIDDSELEDDGDDDDDIKNENHAWDLGKLRENMFAFIDGEGNLVYEKIDEETDKYDAHLENRPKQDRDESDEEKEEEKEESDEEEETTNSRTRERSSGDMQRRNEHADALAAGMKGLTASSVMVLNPRTNKPEAVVREEPLPRINPELVLYGHILFVYGGLLEVGDREVTLDDFWSFDLRKRDRWVCLFPGTMHKQVWRGAVFDDDDSYISTDRTNNDDEDDEDDGDEDEADDSDEVNKIRSTSRDQDKTVRSASDFKRQIKELVETHKIDNDHCTQRPGETLADFFVRTNDYWNNQVTVSNTDGTSSKELKRESFSLAKKRFEELEPILEQLTNLNIERQAAKASEKERVKIH